MNSDTPNDTGNNTYKRLLFILVGDDVDNICIVYEISLKILNDINNLVFT